MEGRTVNSLLGHIPQMIDLLKRAHEALENPTLDPSSNTNYLLSRDIKALLTRIGVHVEL
jgi:hypothetical protein